MIKVGDIVELKDGTPYLDKLQNEVTSISYCGDYLRVNENTRGGRVSQFKVVLEDKSKWRKHHDEIIAWAKGAEIESQCPNDKKWDSVTHPSWFKKYKYRVKPSESTELEKLIQEHKAMGETIDKLTKELMND
jgi:hypothetical protein